MQKEKDFQTWYIIDLRGSTFNPYVPLHGKHVLDWILKGNKSLLFKEIINWYVNISYEKKIKKINMSIFHMKKKAICMKIMKNAMKKDKFLNKSLYIFNS